MYVGKKEDFSPNMRVLFKKPDGFFEIGIIIEMLDEHAVVYVHYINQCFIVEYRSMNRSGDVVLLNPSPRYLTPVLDK